MKIVMVILMVFLYSYTEAKEVENEASGGQKIVRPNENDISKDINISMEENRTIIDDILDFLNINQKDKK